jgi:hypothetical protein
MKVSITGLILPHLVVAVRPNSKFARASGNSTDHFQEEI